MRLSDTVLCALVLGALIPRPALAQEALVPTDIEEAKASARALADHGAELLDAGQHAEALAAFRWAERHYHAPTILLMVARSYERLGKLLEAQWNYEVVVAERLDASAPQAFRDAQQAAKAELAALNRRIPALQILITGADPARVKLTVDGAAIAPGAGAILKDPGRSVVVARIPGRPPVERAVVLKEGQTERLTLDLRPQPAVAPEPALDAPTRESLLPAKLAFGAAGLGFGVGVMTFAVANRQMGELSSGQVQTWTRVSAVGFVGAGVAAAAGVTLLMMRPGGGTQEATKDAAVRVVVGPGSAQVMGRF